MTQSGRGDLVKKAAVPGTQRIAAMARQKVMTFEQQAKDLRERSMILKDALEDVRAGTMTEADIQPILDSVVNDLRDKSRGHQAANQLIRLRRQLYDIPWTSDGDYDPATHSEVVRRIAAQGDAILRKLTKEQAQHALQHQFYVDNIKTDDGSPEPNMHLMVRNVSARGRVSDRSIERSSHDAVVEHLGDYLDRSLSPRGEHLQHLADLRSARLRREFP